MSVSNTFGCVLHSTRLLSAVMYLVSYKKVGEDGEES